MGSCTAREPAIMDRSCGPGLPHRQRALDLAPFSVEAQSPSTLFPLFSQSLTADAALLFQPLSRT